MQFDGADVFVGDKMFDVVHGAGTVVLTQEVEGRLTVKFGAREISYGVNGIGLSPSKSLYWRDPVGRFVPMKNDDTWRKFVELRDAIATVLVRP